MRNFRYSVCDVRFLGVIAAALFALAHLHDPAVVTDLL